MRALLCLLLVSAPTLAHAEMDEWQLSVGPDYRAFVVTGDPDDLTVHVPGLDLGVWYGVDDYWQLGGSLQVGVAIPPDGFGDPASFGTVAAEVRYVLDIVEWVPHLGLAVGGMWNGLGDDVELFAGLGLGLDYRWSREHSVGVDARYDFVLTALDDLTATFHVALVYSWHFE